MQLTIDIQKRQVVSGTDDTGLVFPGNKLVFTYGEVLSVSVSLVKGAQAATPAEGQEFVLALGDDWSLETTPLAVADAVAGQDGSLVFELSLRTETMLDYVDGSRLLPAWLWCYRKEGDGIVPLCSQLVRAHGSVYDDGTPPEDEVRTTYTRAEVDALVASIPSSEVDAELSETSEHPVQNKVVTSALQERLPRPAGTGSSGQVPTIAPDGAIVWDTPPNPDLSDYYTSSQVDSALALKADVVSGGSVGQVLMRTSGGSQWKTLPNTGAMASVASASDAALTVSPDSPGVTDWSPASDCTLSVGSGWEADREYYFRLNASIQSDALLTLGSGLSFDNFRGVADAVVGGYTNVLLVSVRNAGGVVSVVNQRS